ncbi:MAG: alpha/beta hydrolase-fold protein [Candidatus Celaenobacter antarcticus]|nr:alpha/beta hydrolase-fold protein [Candidatus Celaenobacter antarcticus]
MKGDRIKINKILVVLTGFLLLLNILLADTEKEDSLLVEIPDIDIYDELAGDFLDVNPQYLLFYAYQNYNDSNFENAAKFYLAYLSYQNSDANSIYNLACCYGLLGKDSLATSYLKRSYTAGFDDVQHIKGDPDFDGVKDSPIFAALIDSIKNVEQQKIDESGSVFYITATTFHECRIKLPENYDPNETYPLLIGLHGYGDNNENFIKLYKDFPARNFIFAAPQAPYEFGAGSNIDYSWIPRTDDPAIFDEAVTFTENYINSVVTYLQNQFNISEIVLMGFSQGCWITYYTGIKNPLLFKGLLCFGGYLPLDLLDNEVLESAKDLQIYIVHGESDRSIPVDAGINAAAVLQEMGYEVELFIFDGAHEIPKEGLEKGMIWLNFIK